jgi:hypothetical protein
VDVRGGITRTRLEIGDKFDFAPSAFNFTKNLVIGESGSGFVSIRAETHTVRENTLSGGRDEGVLKDVGAVDVMARAAKNVCRVQRPMSTDVGIEQRREDRGTIKARPAEPIDGSIARNQGCGTAVANNSVFVDWAVLALAHSLSSMRI